MLTDARSQSRRAQAIADYGNHIWRLRYFWMSLVRVDLRAKYRRSLLGIGWSLMHPVAMTIVFCTVFSTMFGVDYRTYAPFLLVGLAFWNYLVGTAMQGCQCFFHGESYIRQQAAPLAIYPLRTTLSNGFHFLIALSLAIVLTWCVNGLSNLPALVSLIPTLALLFVVGWCLSICCGVMNVLFQDTQHIVEIALQVLFYLTPIMYPPSLLAEKRMGWLVTINPLASFADLLRTPILEGRLPAPGSICLSCGITLAIIAFAGLILAKVERRLVFYL